MFQKGSLSHHPDKAPLAAAPPGASTEPVTFSQMLLAQRQAEASEPEGGRSADLRARKPEGGKWGGGRGMGGAVLEQDKGLTDCEYI